jgi:hypothetical protein
MQRRDFLGVLGTAVQENRMGVAPDTIVRTVFVALLLATIMVLLPGAGWAQTAATECTLSIEPMGSDGSGGVIMVNASGCSGDIAITAKAGGNQKQFPVGSGPEIFQPFTLSPCDLGITGDKAVSVTYTAVVVSGTNKGKTSAAFTGTIQAPPAPGDNPPVVQMSGRPSPGTFIRPGDTITLTVHATDDIGLTGIKVLDPSGQILLEKKITPVPPSRAGCHTRPPGQSETFSVPKPYTVPPNPPTPVIRFTAIARDTAGHETPAIAEYFTEAVWNGRMIVDTNGIGPGYVCTTNWHVELWVKTSPQNEVSGTAEAQHSPRLSCRLATGPDPGGVTSLRITGTFDGKVFRLHFKAIGGNYPAYGASGLAGLEWPTERTVELARDGDQFAKGPVVYSGKGTVGGTTTISGNGQAQLGCCFSDTGPAAPAKTPPVFLGEDDK